MSNRTLTVVVDGGGSGCRLAAFDARGTLCASAANGPASLSLGEEQTWLHISRGLVTLRDQLGEESDWLPEVLCMGLSGALQRRQRERFLTLLPNGVEPILVTDGHAQLLGATAGEPGVCLAVGTGTVLHWLDREGVVERAGGWGFPAGDEGSGAWLGLNLINAYAWFRDTRRRDADEPVPMIFQALEDRIGTDVADLQSWTTHKRSTEFASLAPMIVTAATEGDALAESLLARGARQCERLFAIAPDELSLYLVGGLADTYRSRLGSDWRDRLRPARGNALDGLFHLARSGERGSA